MRAATVERRGSPLAALVLVIGGWIVLRALLWVPAVALTPDLVVSPRMPVASLDEVIGPVEATQAVLLSDAATSSERRVRGAWSKPDMPSEARASTLLSRCCISAGAEQAGVPMQPVFPASTRAPAPNAQEQVAPRLEATVSSARVPRRLSLDTWVFLREGAQPQSALGPRPASLGASQVGVVVRYALAPEHHLRPAAYARISRALGADAESEAAAGVLVRPLQQVPISAHAEVRLTRQADRLETRPALFVTGGVDDAPLGEGVRLRAYGQAGYVGGRYATGFADGQVVAEKAVVRMPVGTLQAGGGVWGGIQKGASRVDAGPTVSLRVPVPGATVRVEASYRVQVAGEAQPDSGLALTVATGF